MEYSNPNCCGDCCAKCCRSLWLTLMSLITLGVTSVVLIILTILISENEIKEVSNTIYILFIVATVIVCLLLVFAIYASCCGGTLAKSILGVLFIIMGLILLVFGIVVLAFKNNVEEFIVKLFTYGTKEYDENPNARNVLARVFKCSYIGQSTIDYDLEGSCINIITDAFDKYDLACGILLIIFAVLMAISAIICFVYVCKKNKINQ